MFNMYKGLNQDLVKLCLERVSANDPHHRVDHILEVTLNSVILAKKYGLHNLIPFKLAALTHDMFSGTNRKEHHALAATWAMENLAKYGYELYAELVAGMCYAHRDSGDGVYNNRHEEVFAAADRGPLTLRSSVQRSVSHIEPGENVDWQIEFDLAVSMLNKKFGERGYTCFNRVHHEMYGRQVEVFRNDLKNLTFDQFKWIVDNRLDARARIMSLESQYEMFMGA